MVKAVRFHHYGGIDVLQVEDVELRKPAADEALVRVRAAGINPGEANVRTGALEALFPATFPSGEGSDFVGTIVATGADVTGCGNDGADRGVSGAACHVQGARDLPGQRGRLGDDLADRDDDLLGVAGPFP